MYKVILLQLFGKEMLEFETSCSLTGQCYEQEILGEKPNGGLLGKSDFHWGSGPHQHREAVGFDFLRHKQLSTWI